ncbi:hypothetical protein B0I37DRAFT_404266 [Chaetomium sp. MPI-CAGE-AT-0009]|nr:hypothetical protein B0I37DRAFT_404266 [Chaetomium sp. MPI-CAGE-AT-0009]
MRHTLRRSCAACARSKHSCDLGTPRCSRCTKRKVQCVYANEPLTAALLPPSDESGASGPLVGYQFPPVDPFESYPSTRLPRVHVQRLIHSFLHKIAFQYYPLDLNATTNPFLVSWWPLALGDPALFHVSLQTACLDEELIAQKGFHNSEILMADSVALLRRKVENTSLAVQDGTMNSVITLATIEFGKGNIQVAQMHVDGVKRLVGLRGGINAVRQTSPLTARMVSWVSMLIMGHPQFDTQDDMGTGNGIPPTTEWQLSSAAIQEAPPELSCLDTDWGVKEVFIRLRSVFQRAQKIPLTSTRLHDLACFVIHRLLPSAPDMANETEPLTECVRYAIILYMFIMQGPTYFTHAVIFSQILGRFVGHLQRREQDTQDPIGVWFLAVGMVASTGTPHYSWFRDISRAAVVALNLNTWDDASAHIKNVLWLEARQGESIFRPHWDAIFNGTSCPEPSDLAVHASPTIPSAAFI